MSSPKLPPFSEVIKSRDVEDPVNLWLHRPLAYGIVALLLPTPVTPNQITLLAMACGLTAAAFWFVGAPTLVMVGGILLWTSAILDGADGILARAKKMQSELGRALDGTADMLVASATVAGGFYHIWAKDQQLLHLPLLGIALGTAMMQIFLYDFYKECFLNSTNPDWDGRTAGRAAVEARLEQARSEGASLIVRFAWRTYAGMLGTQDRLRRLTNPRGGRDGVVFSVNQQTTEIYRRHNYWPMQLWALISLCPHTYMFAISALFDRLDLYMWYRLLVGNAIFVVAIIWQRIATERTLRDIAAIDSAPVPAAAEEQPQNQAA